MPNHSSHCFSVHPSVVFQLGESLISDPIQALIEIVKNAYDADATYAKLTIDTTGHLSENASGGSITIEDDGHGMTLNDIETGWLTISNRKKQELKRLQRTTPGGRTPLGDKGLGRLGVQRLGERLDIFTKSREEKGRHFAFSWADFSTVTRLEQVEVRIKEFDYPKRHGTKIVVTALKEPEIWHGQKELKRLEQELSRMISPYKQVRDFTVLVQVDGKTLELVEITESLRRIAPIRYQIHFDGTRLAITGQVKLDFFRPQSGKDAEEFEQLAVADEGKGFLAFLQKQKRFGLYNLSRSRTANYFLEFSRTRNFSDIDKLEMPTQTKALLANPGPFRGEIDSFDLGPLAFRHQAVFDRLGEFRKQVKEMSGIRVYRDGFAIRVDHDWLKLGAQWTSATSYYGLKPDNTLGFIALSARENMQLEEKTDREGFKDTPYFRNFYALLNELRVFSEDVQEFFGRSWAEFRRSRNEALANIDSRKNVEDIAATIKKGLSDAASQQESLDVLQKRFQTSLAESRAVVAKLKSSQSVSPDLRLRVTDALIDLEPLLSESDHAIGRLSEFLAELRSLRDAGQVLEDRVEALRDQMDQMYDAIALGLTAEALSHEVFNVADQLATRTKSLQTSLRKRATLDKPVMAFIEYVQTGVAALRKQMSFLSPSLSYVREQRQDISIFAFATELKEFYTERLGRAGITLSIVCEKHTDFVIRMNRGKLMQIIDNLVLNSEYWLKEDIAKHRQEAGVITFELARPFWTVSDNGSGVDPVIESAIFEPFVSAKSKGKGRGLGLFIVKQLLDSEGCGIRLLPQRNKRRRFYKFEIDLRGAIK